MKDITNQLSSSFSSVIPTPYGRLKKVFGGAVDALQAAMGQKLSSGIDPNYENIINQQMELQRQMLLVTLHSNTEKTRHEIQMAPVRNIRVG